MGRYFVDVLIVLCKIHRNGHAVVVVAEGAGQALVDDGSKDTDASGNIKKKDFCSYLCEQIKDHFKERSLPLTLKFIDPSYQVSIHMCRSSHHLLWLQIRSVAANAEDSYMCMLLGSGAVHSAMAGFCGFSIGLINNRTALIPVRSVVDGDTSFFVCN